MPAIIGPQRPLKMNRLGLGDHREEEIGPDLDHDDNEAFGNSFFGQGAQNVADIPQSLVVSPAEA